jgi:hypothetical protein
VETRDELLDLMMRRYVIASIKERQDALRLATRVAKCIGVDGGMFENVLEWVKYTDGVTGEW